ncbi:unnamed protein product [Ectocarpus sp. 12 AP-2014]
MVDQCAAAFNDNGSTIQLHRFLKDDVAQKIVDAAIAADRSDGLGYMEASPFDAGVRGGWRKAGPPHRQRMLRLSSAKEPGNLDGQDVGDGDDDDEIGALLRTLRDKLFRSEAFKGLLQKLLGDSPVVASRREARRFRPGLDYTLATPGAPWEWKKRDGGGGGGGGDIADKGQEGGSQGEEYMVLDAALCFVDDREPYKEAAWRQDEVGGYVTYLGGDDDEEEEGKGGSRSGSTDDGPVPPEEDGGGGSRSDKENGTGDPGEGIVAGGGGGAQKNDAAVYKADEGGSLISVSAASNALSLVLRDDEAITSFVKYVSSAAPGSRYDVVGEYLVACAGEEDGAEDSSSSEGSFGAPGGVLDTVPEGHSGEEEEEEDKEDEEEKEVAERSRKKMKASIDA